MENAQVSAPARLLAAAIVLAPATALAAVCDPYGGSGLTVLEGSTVCFVYDPANVDPLFGTLQVSGDNVFVTPTSFKAESTDAQGTVVTSATGTIQVVAKPGYVLDAINVGEIGDYRMVGGTGTGVDVDGWLRVFDWFDPTPFFGTEETATLAISGDLTIADGNLHNWTGQGGFDLTTPTWDGRDHVGLTLQNTLTAISTVSGESAMIQKKAVGSEITVSVATTAVVPLPGALWLFGAGLAGLVGVARRR
ncbi:VPLPA-CTERM sorting domain-containing protein [Thiohalobacter sp.]|uniref:VPLPA-CTERM sorting domain-containing protein n=1 Tax=Thiohalobacter sp. TaxID=2025948 RepID=UPI002637B272|nr:VPLPA-CTERM sorting domain-containing protein [Thiohalobacter sp.]